MEHQPLCPSGGEEAMCSIAFLRTEQEKCVTIAQLLVPLFLSPVTHPELAVTAYLGLLGGIEFKSGTGFSSMALVRHQEKKRGTFFYSPLTQFCPGSFYIF